LARAANAGAADEYLSEAAYVLPSAIDASMNAGRLQPVARTGHRQRAEEAAPGPGRDVSVSAAMPVAIAACAGVPVAYAWMLGTATAGLTVPTLVLLTAFGTTSPGPSADPQVQLGIALLVAAVGALLGAGAFGPLTTGAIVGMATVIRRRLAIAVLGVGLLAAIPGVALGGLGVLVWLGADALVASAVVGGIRGEAALNLLMAGAIGYAVAAVAIAAAPLVAGTGMGAGVGVYSLVDGPYRVQSDDEGGEDPVLPPQLAAPAS
jgi:hypothetical protein